MLGTVLAWILFSLIVLTVFGLIGLRLYVHFSLRMRTR